MKLLTVSDKECTRVYSSRIKERFHDVDLAIGCGDLSYYYLEYIISSLDVPLYFVRGNHAKPVEYGCYGSREAPWGAVNLHKKVIRDKDTGLILSGIQGSLRYNDGDYQYTQGEMWVMVMQLLPSLIYNKIRYGRYLDIFVTHAPPWGIHDCDDPTHRGVKAFRWFIKTFQPTYHLHGHVHVYSPLTVTKSKLGKTRVINSYGYKKLVIGDQKSAQTQVTQKVKSKVISQNVKNPHNEILTKSVKQDLTGTEQPKNLPAVECLSKSDAV